MERIAVLGCTGAGKTTLAKTLAERLDLIHIELDSIYHQPGWIQLAPGELRAHTLDAVAAANNRWTMCGCYDSEVQTIRLAHADTIVWLDHPRRVIMWRVITRTLRRGITREVLWNGNRESLLNLISLDPHKNLILWAWTTYGKRNTRYEAAVRSGEWDRLEVHRLTSQKAVDTFLQQARPDP